MKGFFVQSCNNKLILILTIGLMPFCHINVRSQSQDLEERTQKTMANAVDWLYDNFEDFDRECFLTGTLEESNGGHYQTFTANKSTDDIDDKVKWLFGKDLKFVPDSMRCQRITTYGNNGILALFVTALFKNGYSDLRTLRVCSVRPFLRYYGSEVKTTADPKDPVCNSTTDFEIELFSSSLAKTVAGYYQFDQDNVSALSSGGDIGYSGAIHKERIATDAQKMSFLAGVFMRYGRAGNPNDSSRYSIHVPVSFSTAKACVDILKEFGCRNIKETQTIRSEYIAFNASDKIRDLIVLIDNLDAKTLDGTVIAF